MKIHEFVVRRFKSSNDFGGYTLSRIDLNRLPLMAPSNKQVVGLEDEFREVKLKGETRIPAGRYQMKVTMSPKFKRELIEILNVPGFTGIRWHSGNTESETDGCLLIGDNHGWKTGKPAVFGGQAGKVEGFVTNLVKGFIKQGDQCWVTYIDEDR